MTLHDTFRASVLALNPSAYWDFQGLAPGALADSSGNGHTLAGNGAWSVGNTVIGWDGFQYASFNGTNAYFSVGGAALVPSNTWTLSAVLQPTQQNAYAWSNENVAGTKGLSQMTLDAAHNAAYGARTGTGGGNVLLQDTVPFSQYGYGYQMVTLVIDPLAVVLYVNGNPVKGALYATRDFNAGVQCEVGRQLGQANYFKGAISDMYILDYSQTLDSIRTVAANTPNPATPSLQALVPQLDAILRAVTYKGY